MPAEIGPADASRIDKREKEKTPAKTSILPSSPMPGPPSSKAPAGAQSIKLTLKNVHITGMTVFTEGEVKELYAPYLEKEISADAVWGIAAKITEKYRNAGYFLSRAIVPQQKISEGKVIIRVVEGYVGDVKLDGSLADDRIVKQWLSKLGSLRPLKADQIESILLSLNDLPGIDLHAVLEPMETVEKNEGAVRLILEPRPVPLTTTSISVDNFGSRFLGPYEATAQVQANLFPLQRTTATVLASVPIRELKYLGLHHEVPVFLRAKGEIYGSYTAAAPGYYLASSEVKSRSNAVGMAFDYNIIRQRRENLDTRFALEMSNTQTDWMTMLLTKDKIRTARASVTYQRADDWDGQNTLSATLVQGINFLGASRPGEASLSRASAKPYFTKLGMNAARLQGITENWNILTSFAGQISSTTLYSSEQFGYGGQAFGRAYDNSEIIGDQGMAGSAELRYTGFGPWYGLQAVPYQFYDIGAIWNESNSASEKHASGSSLGTGVKLFSDAGFSGNVGIAFPLTRSAANPLYGNGKNPRYFFQVSYGF